MHENNKDCLFNNTAVLRSQQRFKSDHHEMYTEQVNLKRNLKCKVVNARAKCMWKKKKNVKSFLKTCKRDAKKKCESIWGWKI